MGVGAILQKVIHDNGFKINPNKVRLLTNIERQEVTGIVVNNFTNLKRNYIRQIRAMLHAWEKYGLESAENEYLTKYNTKFISDHREKQSFARVLRGKIEYVGMVRGKKDYIYQKFLVKLKELAPDLVKTELIDNNNKKAFSARIYTEGKTDWKHLKAAFFYFKKNGKYLNLNLDFIEDEDDKGDEKLLADCKRFSKENNAIKRIYIFDRDNDKIIKQVTSKGGFKDWGNNVYSFAIPVPPHRTNTDKISLEFYYDDKELKTTGEDNRRLFIGTEFHSVSGRHNDLGLNCKDFNKIKRGISIIDDLVFNDENQNVAMSKNEFADNILNKMKGFDSFNFDKFFHIFDIIEEIINL